MRDAHAAMLGRVGIARGGEDAVGDVPHERDGRPRTYRRQVHRQGVGERCWSAISTCSARADGSDC